MAQSNLIKSYIRIDSSGRDVPSTNILRKEKPKSGRWRELAAYECCNFPPPTVVTVTPGAVSGTDWDVTLACGSNSQFMLVPGNATNITTLVALLNTNLSYLGVFSVATNGTDIELALLGSIAADFCGGNAITLTIVL